MKFIIKATGAYAHDIRSYQPGVNHGLVRAESAPEYDSRREAEDAAKAAGLRTGQFIVAPSVKREAAEQLTF